MKIEIKTTSLEKILRQIEVCWRDVASYADVLQIFVVNKREILLREARREILRKRKITLRLYAVAFERKIICELEVRRLEDSTLIEVKKCNDRVVLKEFREKLEKNKKYLK